MGLHHQNQSLYIGLHDQTKVNTWIYRIPTKVYAYMLIPTKVYIYTYMLQLWKQNQTQHKKHHSPSPPSPSTPSPSPPSPQKSIKHLQLYAHIFPCNQLVVRNQITMTRRVKISSTQLTQQRIISRKAAKQSMQFTMEKTNKKTLQLISMKWILKPSSR